MTFSTSVSRVIFKVLQRSEQSTFRSMTSLQLGDMRKAYISSTLLEDDLPTRDPIELFEKWFNTIKDAGLMYEPNAVALATTTKTGLPSCRMVLLKGCGPDGFVFFTNYKSRKGNELEENPNASMLFYWDKHHRQHLEEKHQMLQEKYKGADTVIPRPSEWGGFTLKPKRMEFWQGHSSRLHDRIVFTKLEDDAALPHMARHASNGWIMQRYAP
ncbi:pyridoxine-5'-phosphate oxidase-like isoform X3 [Ornithodoros turicata]|uniref:pyridoxine-5'-phosphate oxidase-like isoform X3 n=1 Tax=Ornithodoros turicata TaxID=34597 RepID=UPI0031390D04